MFRKERGFTLIELLIVIAVIGILSAAILPRFIDYRDAAATGATRGALSSLRAAIVLYKEGTKLFPGADLSDLIPTYIYAIPGEQVKTCTGYPIVDCDVDDEDNTVGDITGSGGGWGYDTDTGELRVNEGSASRW